MPTDTLEGRFWFNGQKPILLIAAHKEPECSPLNYHIDHFDPDRDIDWLINHIQQTPGDAVYTDIEDADFIKALVSMGLIVYMPNPPAGLPVWKTNRFNQTVYTMGGERKFLVREKIKRFFDLLIAWIAMPVLAIIFVPLAIAIKLDSKGPVIFKQERLGYNGRHFRMYKFRTMHRNAEAMKKDLAKHDSKIMFKMENDPRITRLGVFLRKSSIDELPQIINVIRGDMSIVGTRPPTLDEVIRYKPRHRRRLAVKPGITGVWQTHGRSDVSDFEETVNLDLKYVKDDSLGHYIRIIFATIGEVLRAHGN